MRRALEVQPIWNPNATLGKYADIKRFPTLGDRGLSKAQRTRQADQMIGTNRTVSVDPRIRQVRIREFTGPSTFDGLPACLHITESDMRFAVHELWSRVQRGDYVGGLAEFHRSIGSMLLADDYARLDDRILAMECMRTIFKYNPGAKADANVLASDKITVADLRRVNEQLSRLNTGVFPNGKRRIVCDERWMRHLREDPEFQQYAIALVGNSAVTQGQNPTVSPATNAGMLATGIGPMMDAPPPVVYQYENFDFYVTNTLPTKLVTTANGTQRAYLAIAFGPNTVGQVVADRGPSVRPYEGRDYGRHEFFIWQMFGEYEYMLDDDEFSGCSVEIRTYAN
jgi:hypothetical protein